MWNLVSKSMLYLLYMWNVTFLRLFLHSSENQFDNKETKLIKKFLTENMLCWYTIRPRKKIKNQKLKPNQTKLNKTEITEIRTKLTKTFKYLNNSYIAKLNYN